MLSFASRAPSIPWMWTEPSAVLPPPSIRLWIDLSCYLTVGILGFGAMVAVLVEAFSAARRREELVQVHLPILTPLPLPLHGCCCAVTDRWQFAQAEQLNVCTICGRRREDAAEGSDEFDRRRAEEHRPVNYVLYLLYLRAKQQMGEPLSALEAGVSRQAAELDPSWLPAQVG